MMNTGIIELMMWTVLPLITSSAMVPAAATTATIIAEVMSRTWRKNHHIARKITSIASGAEIAI